MFLDSAARDWVILTEDPRSNRPTGGMNLIAVFAVSARAPSRLCAPARSLSVSARVHRRPHLGASPVGTARLSGSSPYHPDSGETGACALQTDTRAR